MRKYFETITGIATGSDMAMKHTPNVALQFSGFKRAGVVDERTWINKSHFPLYFPFQPQFEGDIAVICARNPFDVTPSFFYLLYTMTHVTSFNENLL